MPLIRNLVPYAVLLTLTLVAYLPIWNNDFVDYDDETYLTTNPYVKNGFTGPGFRWIWTVDRAPYWAPLTWLSFQFDAHCFARRTTTDEVILSPTAFHGQNLFWHCANVCLVFSLWRRLTGQAGRSFLVAALFAVHPMHVESVAWAVERKDVLSGFFGLATVMAYLHYREKPGWLRYGNLAAMYLLSLASKPMLLTMPFVLLLLDYWPLGRMQTDACAGNSSQRRKAFQRKLERLILEKMPLFLLAALIAGMTLHSRSERGSLVSLDSVSFSARLANALSACGWYVRTSFCPQCLSVLYLHPGRHWSLASVLSGAGIVLSLSILAWRRVERSPWLFVGWLWFTVTLFPVLGFAQGGKQAWADRFCYWPHLGLFVAFVWGVGELLERSQSLAAFARAASVVGIVALTLLTWNQIGFWRDTPTLWQRVLEVAWNNDQAHEHLARYYHNQRRPAEANYHLQEAVRIQFQRNPGIRP